MLWSPLTRKMTVCLNLTLTQQTACVGLYVELTEHVLMTSSYIKYPVYQAPYCNYELHGFQVTRITVGYMANWAFQYTVHF
ncbi:hypothetical protein XELAEV_18009053mg [Xenopus laevis]|uniref:Uncharacterized protein n=1 Tax=Xenopus laevis TaxID=8355 RepID=A0A974DRV5_XENLA|nr:hypothetical protein XELAEV_18009053mg [Xenopus laevis]